MLHISMSQLASVLLDNDVCDMEMTFSIHSPIYIKI